MDREEFAAELLEWFDGVDDPDYAEACISAALDTSGGNLAEALKRAKAAYKGYV